MVHSHPFFYARIFKMADSNIQEALRLWQTACLTSNLSQCSVCFLLQNAGDQKDQLLQDLASIITDEVSQLQAVQQVMDIGGWYKDSEKPRSLVSRMLQSPPRQPFQKLQQFVKQQNEVLMIYKLATVLQTVSKSEADEGLRNFATKALTKLAVENTNILERQPRSVYLVFNPEKFYDYLSFDVKTVLLPKLEQMSEEYIALQVFLGNNKALLTQIQNPTFLQHVEEWMQAYEGAFVTFASFKHTQSINAESTWRDQFEQHFSEILEKLQNSKNDTELLYNGISDTRVSKWIRGLYPSSTEETTRKLVATLIAYVSGKCVKNGTENFDQLAFTLAKGFQEQLRFSSTVDCGNPTTPTNKCDPNPLSPYYDHTFAPNSTTILGVRLKSACIAEGDIIIPGLTPPWPIDVTVIQAVNKLLTIAQIYEEKKSNPNALLVALTQKFVTLQTPSDQIPATLLAQSLYAGVESLLRFPNNARWPSQLRNDTLKLFKSLESTLAQIVTLPLLNQIPFEFREPDNATKAPFDATDGQYLEAWNVPSSSGTEMKWYENSDPVFVLSDIDWGSEPHPPLQKPMPLVMSQTTERSIKEPWSVTQTVILFADVYGIKSKEIRVELQTAMVYNSPKTPGQLDVVVPACDRNFMLAIDMDKGVEITTTDGKSVKSDKYTINTPYYLTIFGKNTKQIATLLDAMGKRGHMEAYNKPLDPVKFTMYVSMLPPPISYCPGNFRNPFQYDSWAIHGDVQHDTTNAIHFVTTDAIDQIILSKATTHDFKPARVGPFWSKITETGDLKIKLCSNATIALQVGKLYLNGPRQLQMPVSVYSRFPGTVDRSEFPRNTLLWSLYSLPSEAGTEKSIKSNLQLVYDDIVQQNPGVVADIKPFDEKMCFCHLMLAKLPYHLTEALRYFPQAGDCGVDFSVWSQPEANFAIKCNSVEYICTVSVGARL